MAFATRENPVEDQSYDDTLCSLLEPSSKQVLVISEETKKIHVACGAAYVGAKDLLEAYGEESLSEDVVSSYFGGMLSAAARAGHTDIVKMLLNRGHSRRKMQSPHWLLDLSAEVCSTYSFAAAYGHLEIMELVRDLDATGLDAKYTPLFVVRARRTDVVDYLLRHSPKSPSPESISASLLADRMSWMAARYGQADILRDAIQAGGDINHDFTDRYNYPLVMACRKGHTDVVRFLIDMGVDVHKQFSKGPLSCRIHIDIISKEHPIGIATARGYVGVCEQLLDAGVDVNWREGVWMGIAAGCGQTRVMECLMRKGFAARAVRR